MHYVSDTEVQFTRAKIRQQTTLGRFRKQNLALGRYPLTVDGENAHSLADASLRQHIFMLKDFLICIVKHLVKNAYFRRRTSAITHWLLSGIR